MKRHCLALLFAVLVLATAAWSQDVTGNLEGYVLDSEGAPIGGAKLVISGPNLQGTREASTDGRGHFFALFLPTGSYTVKIVHPAYQEATFQAVSIRLGMTTTLGEIRLEMSAQDAREITVTAARPAIDPMSAAGNSYLDVKTAETLPVTRDYRGLTLLLPHATTKYANEETNFAGATGIENRYFIDGIETTDPFRGVSGTRLPYNFVKEIEVRTGGYEAEYRGSLGGILNIITPSGGNAFSGQIFGFFANNRFSGQRTAAYEPPDGGYSQYDFGISLSGPVVRDKIWFFAAYNPAFEREEVNLPGSGSFTDKNTTHIFAAKLTWQASPKTNLVLTLLGDPSSRMAVGDTFGTYGPYESYLNPDPLLEKIRRGGIDISMKATHIVSDSLFLETSMSWIGRREQNLPATARGMNERNFNDVETSTASGGSPAWVDASSNFATFGLKATWLLDRHILKGGLEYRQNLLDYQYAGSFINRIDDSTFVDFNSYSAGRLFNRIPSVFIQDSWETTKRLRLNFGLRWDGEFLVATNGEVTQKILDQYQPRLGVIYQLGRIGSQSLVASFGRFYEDMSLWGMTFFGTPQGGWFLTGYDHDPRLDPSGGVPVDSLPNLILPRVQGLEGQHYDEFAVGYNRLFGKAIRVGARGIYRTLRRAIEDGQLLDPDDEVRNHWGNPGYGDMTALPKASRKYTALELTVERFGGRSLNFFASYVLSRNYGNYNGLSWFGAPAPNTGGDFDNWTHPNYFLFGSGLLANDRPHVLKFSGSYRLGMGLTLGAFAVWESGTPLTEFGRDENFFPIPLSQLGTVGRTPAVLDLNFRATYDLERVVGTSWAPRIFLDVFHLGSTRAAVEFDQNHYLGSDADGNQILPNSSYLSPTRYFPSMSARLGFEFGF
jgi:hypothetical protein